jgi:hypothetical protein
MWNRREFSASSYDDQSHDLHPHPYATTLGSTPRPNTERRSAATGLRREEIIAHDAHYRDAFEHMDTNGDGESFLRVHWVAVPKALRARRVNRRALALRVRAWAAAADRREADGAGGVQCARPVL